MVGTAFCARLVLDSLKTIADVIFHQQHTSQVLFKCPQIRHRWFGLLCYVDLKTHVKGQIVKLLNSCQMLLPDTHPNIISVKTLCFICSVHSTCLLTEFSLADVQARSSIYNELRRRTELLETVRSFKIG